MKKIFIITAIAIIALLPGVSQSQTKQNYTVGWNISKPLGNSDDIFLSATSLAGFSFNGQIYITDNFAVGFGVGWNNYYEKKDRETYSYSDGFAITASQYRYINYVPFKASGIYNFNPSSLIEPYAALNIGFNYMSENIFIQENTIWTDQYGFILAPEIGAFIHMGKDSPLALNISAAYGFNTNQFEFIKEYKNFQNLTFNIGLTFMIGQ